MASAGRRAAAIRAGSAKTSAASLAVSRAERTAGNVTENRPCPGDSASKRTSGRTPFSSSLVHRRRPLTGVSAVTSARA